MRIARTILISATLLASFGASAQTPPQPPAGEFGNQTGSGPNFEAAKQKHLARLEMYMNCVRQSTSFEAMKACHPHHH